MDVFGLVEKTFDINPANLYLLFKGVIAAGVVLLLKSIVERWVAYYQFMSNKRLGIGVKVEVRGKIGKIRDYTRKWIFIRLEDGNDIIIPIKDWVNEKWELINNGKE